MTLSTYKEALDRYGSRSAVMQQVRDGKLIRLQRNLYSTDPYTDTLIQVMKLYPQGILTGHTAFYIHGLTERIPTRIDLATRRNSTRINNPEVKQHFIAVERFDIGATMIDHDGVQVRIFNLEMMLFYLVHRDGMLPFDLYKEVMKGYRKRTSELDYRKLQEYAAILPGGRRNLERIIKEVL